MKPTTANNNLLRKSILTFFVCFFLFQCSPLYAQCSIGITASALQNVLCNGGATGNVQATVTGGTSPFTYSWSNGTSTVSTANPTGAMLTTGTYTVKVTDANGCSASNTIYISQPVRLTVSIGSQANIDCNGNINGSITASVPASANLTSNFGYTGTVKSFIVPDGVTTLTITSSGGQGGNGYSSSVGGKGATFTGIVSVMPSHVIDIVVGQIGTNGGGGGGTYIYDHSTSDSLIMVAGGGGGGASSPYNATGGPGGTDIYGTVTQNSASEGTDGTGGNGGGGGVPYGQFGAGSGGAGWISNGASVNGSGINYPCAGGNDHANGFGGGYGYNGSGGYGGGGGGAYNAGGGGGGYNGGGGGYTSPLEGGDGGGSYMNLNYGTLSGSVIANNIGNGSVNIQYTVPPAGTPPYTYTWSPNVSTTASASNLSVGTYTILVTDANGCNATVSTTITQPNTFAMAPILAANITCNGLNNGAASETPAGGGAPFTYSWSNGATTSSINSLSAGTYSVFVQDACGGSGTASVTITQPASPLADGTPVVNNNVDCYGNPDGSATAAIATGGTSPYTYSWNGGATSTNATNSSLYAGTYTIIVIDHNGCTAAASQTITITQPSSALAVNISGYTNVTCSGANSGSATSNVSGGISPYTYSWAPSGGTNSSASSLSAGSYTVTVSDNYGCSASASVSIVQTDLLTFAGNANFAFVSSADQSWTVPAGVTQITVSATGGAGGNANYGHFNGGHGATVNGVIAVTPGENLSILVGGQGYAGVYGYGGGGGGGTYIWDANSSSLIMVAGGGGGASCFAHAESGGDGQSNVANLNAATNDPDNLCGAGGTGGNGGNSSTDYEYVSSAGAGWFSNGENGLSAYGGNPIGGKDPVNGGAGGTGGAYPGVGGFGGGGCGDIGGGGGGGYNGGGGGGYYRTGAGGGGGSYCSGTATSAASSNTGNGSLSISYSTLPLVVNATCVSGGSISATGASGGASPYTYNWTPSGGTNLTTAGLSAGSYTLTVTDANGCTATEGAIITQPARVTLSAVVVGNVSCNGGNNGSALVSASGGTSPYTYSWSNGNSTTTANISNLTYGTYTVTITDNTGCSAKDSVTITQPSRLVYVSAGVINHVKCNGYSNGKAAVTPVGGVTPYAYSWSNGTTTVSTSQTTQAILSAGTYTVTVRDSCGFSASAMVTITQPKTVMGTITSTTNISCNGGNGGSLTVTGSGGCYPYSYSWSTGSTLATATGLSAGTYSVTLMDKNGCSSTTTTGIITQPAVLFDSVTSLNYTSPCAGGTGNATVGGRGGTLPYTYTWTLGVSTTSSAMGLTARSYTVTVKDAHGCSSSVGFTITQVNAVRDSIVKAATVNPACSGNTNGSATVGVKYGTAPYTYSWTPNVSSTATATGLSVGTYSVSVTDSKGCPGSTVSVTITQPAQLRDSIAISTNVGCYGGNGGSASVGTRGGTTPYTYLWSNSKTTYNISSLTAGTYTVSITDNHGCPGTAAGVIITQPATALTVSIPTPTCIGGGNGTVVANAGGGTPAYAYLWSNGSSTTSITVASATYTVKVSDVHGCNATTSVTFSCGPVIENRRGEDERPVTECCPALTEVSLYPNPNNGQFTLEGLTKGMTVEMYDYTGRKISAQSNIDNSKLTINLSDQSNGVYLIRILDKNGILVSQKKMVKTN